MRFLLILIIVGSSTKTSAQHDTILIRHSFEDLKYALSQGDGNKALPYVDKNTFSFYSTILLMAKTYDSAKVEALPILEKVHVFMIRFNGKKDNIQLMDDTSFFYYAVKTGLIGKVGNSIIASDLGNITISKDSARGQLMISLIGTPFSQVVFRNEANKWKVDLTSLFLTTTFAFKHMAIESKKSDTEFIISIIKSSDAFVDEKILWKPLNIQN